MDAQNCSSIPGYFWDFGDGTTSTEPSPSHTYTAPGTYAWRLQVSAEDAVCSAEGIVTASAPGCVLACSASAVPTSGLRPLQVIFEAEITLQDCQGAPTFLWDFGDGHSSGQQSVTHTYARAGVFTWTLNVALGDRHCSGTGTIEVIPRRVGDANGDGIVTIGEVQTVINQFLGAALPSPDADCDGNGAISIGEVQKSINAFLGLDSSC